MALMSERESERIQILVMPRCWAWERASRIANPSAISADETQVWYWHPSDRVSDEAESKIQARPAVRDSFFQAASVLQVTVPIGIDGGLAWIWVFFCGELARSWACSHSRAFTRDLVAVACAEVGLDSNRSLFRAVHRFQHTQEKMSLLIPLGGKQVHVLDVWAASLTDKQSPGSKLPARGIRLHTWAA